MRMRVIGCGLSLAWLLGPGIASAQPDPALSYFVVQSGSLVTPTEGPNAIRLLRLCPNNDGATSFPQSVRLKIVLKATGGAPLANVAAADIFVRFNGGTQAQGFFGPGADSIVANAAYNPGCPTVQYLFADGPSNTQGEAFLTFQGAGGFRDAGRKWGHYDSELPVFALGVQLQGRPTSGGNNGDYVLRIKNIDFQGGLGTRLSSGEAVSSVEYNSMIWNINVSDPLSYWRDFDGNGIVSSADLNLLTTHMNHNCTFPNNP